MADDGRRTDADRTLEQLFEVAGLLTDALDHGLAAQGLTRARAEVLWRLHHAGAATQRELADALRCTPRNVTGLVDALEGQELVAREPHPADRRAVLVTLTPQGERIVAGWSSAYRGQGQELFAEVAPDDLDRFRTVLELLTARLRPGADDLRQG